MPRCQLMTSAYKIWGETIPTSGVFYRIFLLWTVIVVVLCLGFLAEYGNQILFVKYPDICIVSRTRTVEKGISFIRYQINCLTY
jgi:hypothetical protein